MQRRLTDYSMPSLGQSLQGKVNCDKVLNAFNFNNGLGAHAKIEGKNKLKTI